MKYLFYTLLFCNLFLLTCSPKDDDVSSNNSTGSAESAQSAELAPFIFTWQTLTANETLALPLKSGYEYNFVVGWGDDSYSEVRSYDDNEILHTYNLPGDYTVIIWGLVEAWHFPFPSPDGESDDEGEPDESNDEPDDEGEPDESNDESDSEFDSESDNQEGTQVSECRIISVSDLGDVGWKDLGNAFYGCTDLEEVHGGNVSQVTDMSHMFEDAIIVNPDMSEWDFGNVVNMENMFTGVTLSTDTYSVMLSRINETSEQSGLILDGGSSQYNFEGDEARKALEEDRGWIINDEGLDTSTLPPDGGSNDDEDNNGDGGSNDDDGSNGDGGSNDDEDSNGDDGGNDDEDSNGDDGSNDDEDNNDNGNSGGGSTIPYVTSVAITSRPINEDTYGQSENIEVSVTFSEAVKHTGNREVSLFVNSLRGAEYLKGSGNKTLVFSYKIKANDKDNNGVSIGWSHSSGSEGLIGTGTITSVSSGKPANVSYAAQNNLSDHKVDGDINNINFVSVWEISNDNDSIILPLHPGFQYNFIVDWGDNTQSEVTSHNDPDRIHTYKTKGTYTLNISGLAEAWFFNNSGDKDKIIKVNNFGDMGWKNLENSFYGCTNLRIFRGGNVSEVTDMSRMFSNATSVVPEISYWDVSQVTDMSRMFYKASSANPDVSGWDVSKVTNMMGLFDQATSLKKDFDLSHWDFSSVTNMKYMLSYVPLYIKTYNALLQRLSETATQNNVVFNGVWAHYSENAQEARETLTDDLNWTIDDWGKKNISPPYVSSVKVISRPMLDGVYGVDE